jgi:hypothetical protein
MENQYCSVTKAVKLIHQPFDGDKRKEEYDHHIQISYTRKA